MANIIQWIILNWKSITGTAAIAAGIVKGSYWLYKRYKKIAAPIKTFIGKVDQQGNDIAEIKKNVLPNGGKSLYDNISKLQEQVTGIDGKIELVMGRQYAMIHEIQMPMFECSPDGVLLDVNRLWLELTGLDKEEALGEGWKKIIYKDDLDYVIEVGESFIEHGVNFNDSFRMINFATKKIFTVQSTSTKVYNTKKQVITILGSLKVIS